MLQQENLQCKPWGKQRGEGKGVVPGIRGTRNTFKFK